MNPRTYLAGRVLEGLLSSTSVSSYLVEDLEVRSQADLEAVGPHAEKKRQRTLDLIRQLLPVLVDLGMSAAEAKEDASRIKPERDPRSGELMYVQSMPGQATDNPELAPWSWWVGNVVCERGPLGCAVRVLGRNVVVSQNADLLEGRSVDYRNVLAVLRLAGLLPSEADHQSAMAVLDDAHVPLESAARTLTLTERIAWLLARERAGLSGR